MLKKQFAVLMSTYNGELFIKEQIDSILAQKDVDITLYIRDDGSNDNTVKLIKEYIKKYDCIRFMNDNNNLRPGASFMKLLLSVLKKKKNTTFMLLQIRMIYGLKINFPLLLRRLEIMTSLSFIVLINIFIKTVRMKVFASMKYLIFLLLVISQKMKYMAVQW